MNLDILSKIIYVVAKEVDQQAIGVFHFGLFALHEQVFTYLCAKKILESKEEIFCSKDYDCIRDVKISRGITDLYFKNDKEEASEKLAIEFKLKVNLNDYLDDIIKLSEIDLGNTKRVFCSCSAVFEDQFEVVSNFITNDKYTSEISSLIRSFEPFETKHPIYKRKTYC